MQPKQPPTHDSLHVLIACHATSYITCSSYTVPPSLSLLLYNICSTLPCTILPACLLLALLEPFACLGTPKQYITPAPSLPVLSLPVPNTTINLSTTKARPPHSPKFRGCAHAAPNPLPLYCFSSCSFSCASFCARCLSRAASSLLAASLTRGTAHGPLALAGAAAAFASSDSRLQEDTAAAATNHKLISNERSFVVCRADTKM